MVHTRSVRAGNSSLPHGQGQPHNNLPPPIPPQILPQLPPQVPTIFPPANHAEGGDENQPHASAHNSTSTANQDVVTAQLAAMQQQFGVFQLVLAQLLARNNRGDPLINLLTPAQQPPAPQQNPQPIPPAPAISESQGQSHIAPAQQPIPDDVTRRLDSLEKLVAEHRDGYRSEHALKFNFDATNNMAEYEALLLSLQLALELKISAIQVYSDSQLVVNQINSICEVVDPVMVKYVALVAELKCKFQKFYLSKIPRAENEQADSLSKFAFDSSLSSISVFVEVLDESSFTKPRVMEISTNPDTPSWTDSIVSFLRDGIVPEDRQEAMKLRKKASRYTLVDGVLYKRSFSLPLLRCLSPYEVEYALREVHEGVCGSHVGARTLAHKVLRQGYYWPNMYKDATYFVQKCLKCQFFAHLTHQPAEELASLVAPWPFAQWGLDLLGPFVKGVGGVTHLLDHLQIWDPKPDCG
ncbi:hypothetical protein SLEP1_g22179 [Rubroshorea leprosula]|uniref:RNase H type-1 domain-containing protein n=1 Tax=Rubroshorea leprosula TaxID=152421 RepID=A0AAV5J8D1_9ROSI|nr:hypothetical protein SLEP1_g22179 [Rubroshorea leprosula]